MTTFDSFLRRIQCAVEVYCKATDKNVDGEMRALLLKLNSSLSDRCPVEIKWAKLLRSLT